MEFSVVVPVCNEAGNVQPLVAEIAAAMRERAGWEIIYVDDGSDDTTLRELRKAQSIRPNLRVLRHPRRFGQSSALLTGVGAARAPWIITLDGDGQNDPADIRGLIERLAPYRADPAGIMLAGHRTRREDGLSRRLASRVANRVRARLLKDATPDTGCGLKVFPREAFLRLPAFDHMHRFLPALMQREGVRVISVPVGHRARRRGESKYGIHNRLWVGLVDLVGVMWLQRRRPGRGHSPNGPLQRLCDCLGVAWLQRRPCRAPAQEEVCNV